MTSEYQASIAEQHVPVAIHYKSLETSGLKCFILFFYFRLIINHSLESGTQLPYIKRAKEVRLTHTFYFSSILFVECSQKKLTKCSWINSVYLIKLELDQFWLAAVYQKLQIVWTFLEQRLIQDIQDKVTRWVKFE